jgi:hypothetical protein
MHVKWIIDIQYSIRTLDDGRLRPKHVVEGESEGINSCMLTEVIIVWYEVLVLQLDA